MTYPKTVPVGAGLGEVVGEADLVGDCEGGGVTGTNDLQMGYKSDRPAVEANFKSVLKWGSFG